MSELNEVLEELKRLGKITDDDIRRVSWASKDRKRVVDALHLLLCTKSHDTECDYMKEDAYDDCWTMPEHQVWLKKADNLCTRLGIGEDVSKALAIYRDAMEITKDYTLPAIYLALSALRPELLEALPLSVAEVEPVTALVVVAEPVLLFDSASEDEPVQPSVDTEEIE